MRLRHRRHRRLGLHLRRGRAAREGRCRRSSRPSTRRPGRRPGRPRRARRPAGRSAAAATRRLTRAGRRARARARRGGAHALWNLLLARARDPEAATAVALVLAALVFAPVAASRGTSRPGRALRRGLGRARARLLRPPRGGVRALGAEPRLPAGARPRSGARARIAVAALGAGTSAAQVAGVLAVGAGILLVRGIEASATARARCSRWPWPPASPATRSSTRTGCATPTRSPTCGSSSPRWRPGTRPRRPARAAPAPCAPRRARPRSPRPWRMFGAYALALAALRLAPAAARGAVRESSVVIATALAALVLHERVTRAAGGRARRSWRRRDRARLAPASCDGGHRGSRIGGRDRRVRWP